MRQRKSNKIIYFVLFVVAAAIIFLTVKELPVSSEHVEQTLNLNLK